MGWSAAVSARKCPCTRSCRQHIPVPTAVRYHVKSSQVVGLRDRVAIIRTLIFSSPHPYVVSTAFLQVMSCTQMQACDCAVLQNSYLVRLLTLLPSLPLVATPAHVLLFSLDAGREVDPQLIDSAGNVARRNNLLDRYGKIRGTNHSEGARTTDQRRRRRRRRRRITSNIVVTRWYMSKSHTPQMNLCCHIPNQQFGRWV